MPEARGPAKWASRWMDEKRFTPPNIEVRPRARVEHGAGATLEVASSGGTGTGVAEYPSLKP